MLARRNRFHGHGSLRHVYQRGQTVRSGNMSLKTAPNPRRSTYRAAVVVSRKVHKSAVVRNRIRRRIYEQLRLILPKNDGFDLVVLVYDDGLATVDALRLHDDLKGLVANSTIALPR